MLVVAGLAGLWSGTVAVAQTPTPTPAPNLLINGSLEGPYYAQGGPTRTVPQGWNLWVGAGAPEALPYNQNVEVLDGDLSWTIKQGGVAFVAAGYQQVTGLTPGETVRATAYGWVFTCGNTQTQCVTEAPPYRRSNSTAGASLKVGIDPTGGDDPLADHVRWSAAVAPYDQWIEMTVTATAQDDAVTVFLYMSQQTGLAINQVFWDDASLVVATGDGPDSGEVPFVVPQGVRPDGSIVHVVQAGDTLWSIAYAYVDYDVTVDSIAALNDGIKTTTRYLQLGQQIMILPPGSVDPVTGRLLSETPEQSASPTPMTEEPGASVTPDEVLPTIPASDTAEPATMTPTPGTQITRDTQALPALPGQDGTPATEEPITEEPTIELTEEPTATEEPTVAPTATATATATATVTETATATATAAATETATAVLMTETPTVTPEVVAGLAATTGTICVTVFKDTNLNAMHDDGETVLSGAQISVSEVGGNSESFASGGASDSLCLDLAAGHYLIGVRLPNGYGLTTPEQTVVVLVSGREVDVTFGGANDYVPPPTPEGAADVAGSETLEPGAVAPLIEEPVVVHGDDDQSVLDRLYDNSGLFVLAAAGVIVIGGGLALLLLRRG